MEENNTIPIKEVIRVAHNELQFPIKEVIRTAYHELQSVNVPAALGPDAMMNLSLPIARAMKNLLACLNAIQEVEKAEPIPEPEKAEKSEPIPEPEEEEENVREA